MRLRALLALIFLATACGPPPTIKLSAPPWPHPKNTPLEIYATVTWSDGLPFRGPVEFRTLSGRISPARVTADSSGTAKTVLTASAAQVLVTAEASSASESVWFSFE